MKANTPTPTGVIAYWVALQHSRRANHASQQQVPSLDRAVGRSRMSCSVRGVGHGIAAEAGYAPLCFSDEAAIGLRCRQQNLACRLNGLSTLLRPRVRSASLCRRQPCGRQRHRIVLNDQPTLQAALNAGIFRSPITGHASLRCAPC